MSGADGIDFQVECVALVGGDETPRFRTFVAAAPSDQSSSQTRNGSACAPAMPSASRAKLLGGAELPRSMSVTAKCAM